MLPKFNVKGKRIERFGEENGIDAAKGHCTDCSRICASRSLSNYIVTCEKSEPSQSVNQLADLEGGNMGLFAPNFFHIFFKPPRLKEHQGFTKKKLRETFVPFVPSAEGVPSGVANLFFSLLVLNGHQRRNPQTQNIRDHLTP